MVQLIFAEPAAKEAFYEWYKAGSNGDYKEPEDHPDIEAIVYYYNNEVAYGPAAEVKNA